MWRPDSLPWFRESMNHLIDAGLRWLREPLRETSPAKLRVLVALIALLMMVMAARSASAEPQLAESRDPVVIAVPLTDPIPQLDPATDANQALRRATVEQVNRAARSTPGELIVVDLRRATLRFDRLSSDGQARLTTVYGHDAAQWYESAAAELLRSIVTASRAANPDIRLSVPGLPIEGRSAVVEPTNRRYSTLLDELDSLVSDKRLNLSSEALNDPAVIQRKLPFTFAARDGRPMYVQINNQWHVYSPQSIQSDGPPTKHTAQDAVLDGAMQTLAAHPDLQSLLREHGIDPDALPRADDGRSYDQQALTELLADWGRADSPWDLNGDGIVNVFDLLILLREWDPADDEPQGAIARFVGLGSQYFIGSGENVRVEMLGGAPDQPNVVFQTWSDVTNSIEAVYEDRQPPFVYPSGALDQVTPGSAEVQALIRDAQDHVVLRLTARVEFIGEAPGGGDPSGDDDDEPDDDPDDEPEPDDDPQDDPSDPWNGLFDSLDPALLEHLRPIELPADPELIDPIEITVRSAGDIPHAIGSNRIITVDGVIELSDPNDGFIFNEGASDVIVRFASGAMIRYTGGESSRAIFQFRSTCARIRIEDAVIVGRVGTSATCHGFATMLGDGTCSDIAIIGGDVSGVRYAFQGEGGCERLLIRGVNARHNWEYFVWGSNHFVDATICHNIVDGVEAQHGIRLAPGVNGVNIVGNDIRIGTPGLLKRTIWIPGADNVSILGNRTRDGRITIGPNPAFNEPGPNGVILAGNSIEHDRNNLAIELFSGARNVLVSANTVTTPHSNWMQCGTADTFHRPFENIHWTEDNVVNTIERHGFDGVRVSPEYVGRPDIGPVD